MTCSSPDDRGDPEGYRAGGGVDRDAEAMLQKHLGQIDATQVNSRILFQKIKERLAKERDVVL